MEAGGEWDTFAEQIELVCTSLKVNIEKIQFSCLYSVSCPLFHPLQTETRFVFLCDWVLARQVHKSQGPEKLLAARSISVNNFSPPQNRINPLFQHRIVMKIFLLFFCPHLYQHLRDGGKNMVEITYVLHCVKSIIDKKGLCRAATLLPQSLLKSRKTLPCLQQCLDWARSYGQFCEMPLVEAGAADNTRCDWLKVVAHPNPDTQTWLHPNFLTTPSATIGCLI